MSVSTTVSLIALFILLILSGFFSSAETALTTVNKIRIKTLSESGDPRADTLQRIFEHSEKMLSAILIGNNIVNISASSLATSLTMHFLGDSGVALATGVMTLLVLIFGEITPKNMAAANAERLSLSYSGIIWFLMVVMTPAIFLVNKLSSAVFALLHVDRSAGESVLTEDDLRTLVDVGHEDGAIESEEKVMINNVFDFGDARARDVMVPWVNMVCCREDDTYVQIRDLFQSERFTRIPVLKRGKDEVIGVINLKDFAFVTESTSFRPEKIMYSPYYTFERKKISELLLEMRERAAALSIVLDEYGAVAGMLTMEDLLEELVGEIRDEYDGDEQRRIRSVGADTWLIEGSVSLDDVNDALDLSLESEDYDSIGGYIIGQLDHFPVAGEKTVTPEGHILRAERVHNQRIDLVRLRKVQPKE